MAKQTVADQFVEILLAAGVRRIYGVVGDSLNPVVDAVRHHDGIDWIHVRHEEAGAFAAGAEAQLTGRLAACAGSCGPGNLHLINGLYDAHRCMAPVLALASHIPSTEIGTGYFQETHPDAAVPRVQPLLRADLQPRADAAGPPDRDPARARPRRGQSRRPPRRRRRRCPARDAAGARPSATSRPTVRPGDAEIDELVGMVDEARQGHAVLRQRHRRRPRRGHGPRRAAQGPGGPRAAGQGMDPVRQPL